MRRPAPALSVATCGFHVYLVEGPLLSVLPPTGPEVRGRPPPRGAAARTAAHPAGARKCHDAVAVHLHADRVRLSRAPRFRLGAVRAPGVPRGCWPWAPGVTRRKASFLARSSADVHPPTHTLVRSSRAPVSPALTWEDQWREIAPRHDCARGWRMRSRTSPALWGDPDIRAAGLVAS